MKKAKNFFFTIGAIFRNESHILKEWMEHYIYFGCDHFILIDNGSTDDFFPILKPYIDKKIVNLHKDPENYAQLKFNALILEEARHKTEWLAILDLDEFLYPSNLTKCKSQSSRPWTIPEILNKNKDIGGIVCPWVFFGSSGFIRQPDSVVHNFLMRMNYGQGKEVNVKTIYNVDKTDKIIIHNGKFKDGYYSISSNKNKHRNDTCFETVTEKDLKENNFELVINHYAIQSWNFFKNIKMSRGDINKPENDKIRNRNYFNTFNKNEILDTKLSGGALR